jgi:hypothetical protein
VERLNLQKIISAVCALVLIFGTIHVQAEEVMPRATNIASLGAAICHDNGCIVGEVSGIFTGEGLHAIYYSNIQYWNDDLGDWVNVDSGRAFRTYRPGDIDYNVLYYWSPVIGTEYRLHVFMKVVDSDGNVWDASVVNSISFVYPGP